MEAKYFFKKKRCWIGTEKAYMILLLSAKEQARLEKAGGFDQILNPTVEKFFLKGFQKFGDGKAVYVFRSLLKDLDYVRKGLEKHFNCKCRIRNINDEPSLAELLAKHAATHAGKFSLYTDSKREAKNRKKGKLYAAFRALHGNNLEFFTKACSQCGSRLTKEFQTEKIAIVRGYKSDIDSLCSLLNCEVKIREYDSYENLLIYDNAA